MPRFRLSSVLLLTVIVALSLAWYLDHPALLRDRLIGEWRHPFPGVGYWETLTFFDDGSFERLIEYRSGEDRFWGKYSVDEKHGEIDFTFEKRDGQEGEMVLLTKKEKERADSTVSCAINGNGDLLLVSRHIDVAYRYNRREDECCIPSRNYVRGSHKPSVPGN